MKPTVIIPLIIAIFSFSSCTSEYEECLKEGRSLKQRLSDIEQNEFMISNDVSNLEVKEIYDEINLLAKVSGNEDLFMKEVFGN